jgi:hypothetical protein
LRRAKAARLSSLAARLNVESYLLNALGPMQRELSGGWPGSLADLRQRVTSSAVDNLRRDDELREALAQIAARGIDLVLLKGSALRASRPGVGLAGRYQCDVDVLVRREKLEDAEGILRGLGFRLDDSVDDRQGMLRRHFHLAYERAGAVVELHWGLDPASPAGFVDRFWDRSRPCAGEEGLRVPAPEHQILFGCLHLCRHAFYGGLRWLADLRLELPLPPEVAVRFEREAGFWPRRAARTPLWLLGLRDVPGAEPYRRFLEECAAADRLVLPRLLLNLLLTEPWLGVPAWRLAKALHPWLHSEGPLLPRLVEVSGAGVASRLSRPGLA